MFYQIFLSPQVKQSRIISNKHGINKLHHKLVNDLRLRILENYEISGKSQNFIELSGYDPPIFSGGQPFLKF